MNDINNKNVGFPEEENLDIEAIFGNGDNADADLPPVEDTDIFADAEAESADAVPVTDSQTVSASEEPESESAVPGVETPESPAQTNANSADANSPEGNADASVNEKSAANAEPPKHDGEKSPETSKNTRKPARKNVGKSAEKSKSAQEAGEAEPDLFTAFADGDADAPLSATKSETPAADSQPQSLFDKPPVFSYGGAKEKIEDSSQTFEELRILKADDFPELGEGKSVSWKVKYGTVTKPVADPKRATIASVKEEIEKSKSFLDGLAKAKDKNPDCLVIPSVIAKSKGKAIAAYKGVFHTLEAARKSDKLICLIPARDGKIYSI